MVASFGGLDITSVVGNVWYAVLVAILFDIASGLLAAGVEKKINSSISYVGMIKKVGFFVVLAFCVFVDAYVSANGQIIKIGVGMIVACEVISAVENFSRIGINIRFITKFFDKNKVGKDDK